MQKGTPATAETRARMSAAASTRWSRPGAREEMSALMRSSSRAAESARIYHNLPHARANDVRRDAYLAELGITTVRVTSREATRIAARLTKET